VLLASHGNAAGDGALQLGRTSLAGKPDHATGRGYHSTQSGELVDVWHWKAVRTHDLGQADDSHFGTPYPAVPGEPRYTGGYKSPTRTTAVVTVTTGPGSARASSLPSGCRKTPRCWSRSSAIGRPGKARCGACPGTRLNPMTCRWILTRSARACLRC
jgi:hypothetical protein